MKKLLLNSWRKIAARPSFRKLNERMFECSLHGLGNLNFQNENVSGERHFIHKTVPLFYEDDTFTVVDVGANVGNYTDLVRGKFPNSRVIAFEPNPGNFKSLEKRFLGGGVVTEMKGLGSSEATLKFYDRKDYDGVSSHGSLYKEVIEDLHHVDSVEMEISVTTLDAYVRKTSIDRISLLKIDTEGHELEVLKGARELIDQGRIDLVHIEFNEMNIVSRVFFKDFAEVLGDYRAYRLLPSGAIPLKNSPLKTELFAFQNIVFVHKRFEPNDAMRPTRKGSARIAA